jgi:sec-independent protein translocase protein TatA
MFGIGPPELLVIFLIILVLFGAKRLPELARSLGKSINEFKNATQNIKDELDFEKDDHRIPNQKPKPKADTETETSKKEDLAG